MRVPGYGMRGAERGQRVGSGIREDSGWSLRFVFRAWVGNSDSVVGRAVHRAPSGPRWPRAAKKSVNACVRVLVTDLWIKDQGLRTTDQKTSNIEH